MFDAHTHLDAMAQRAGLPSTEFVAGVMAEAAAVGVVRVITVGDTIAASQWCVAAAGSTRTCTRRWPSIRPRSPGWTTPATPSSNASPPTRGWSPSARPAWTTTGTAPSPAEQQHHFRRHIELAKRVGKPLMIHDRDAHADVLRILREEGAPDQVVFHAFSGDAAMARECVAAGYMLSFPGVVTFRNAPALRAAAAVVPLEHLLVETDAPFLTPHPMRGRPNAPRLLPLTVRALAAAGGHDLDELCAAITANGARVFGLPAA